MRNAAQLFLNRKNIAARPQDGLCLRCSCDLPGERRIEPGEMCGRTCDVALRQRRQHRVEIGVALEPAHDMT